MLGPVLGAVDALVNKTAFVELLFYSRRRNHREMKNC
jgi:hypothetical protein